MLREGYPMVRLVLFMALLLSGCTVTVVPVATGGSRSDGIVKMSYQFSPITIPQFDQTAAIRKAAQYCQNWGYDTAEPFDAGLTSCSQPSAFGCDMHLTTIEYQCIHSE